jgi:hypothetical protein
MYQSRTMDLVFNFIDFNYMIYSMLNYFYKIVPVCKMALRGNSSTE